MAKSSASKKTEKEMPSTDTNAAFSRKRSDAVQPAEDNPSKYQPTADAETDTMLLDPADGVQKLFLDCVKDIYWAENHLVNAIPKMMKAASLPALQEGLAMHLEQTVNQVQRLEQVFELLGKKPQAKKCDAMEGLTKEGEGVIEMTDSGTPARNLGIVLAAQKVEHYEIASYTGLVKLATNLGFADVASILAESLAEEEATDAKLADIADAHLMNFEEGINITTTAIDRPMEEEDEMDYDEEPSMMDDQAVDEVEPLDDEEEAK